MSQEISTQLDSTPSVYENRALMIYQPDMMANFERIGKMMAENTSAIPDHLRNKPADCTAVAIQSYVWGMLPHIVAQKTHIVGGKLGYEAQLVQAVVEASGEIRGKFKYKYSSGWDRLVGRFATETVQKPAKGGGTYSAVETVKKWGPEDEAGLWVNVGAVKRGDTEVTWMDNPLYLAEVHIRNSPLWVTKPNQQIGYLGVKMWARQHTPGALLGIYTVDELPDAPEYIPGPADMRADSPSAISRDEPHAEDATIIEPTAATQETAEEIDARFSRMIDEISAADDMAALQPLELRIRSEFEKPETVGRYNELVAVYKGRRNQIRQAMQRAREEAAEQPAAGTTAE